MDLPLSSFVFQFFSLTIQGVICDSVIWLPTGCISYIFLSDCYSFEILCNECGGGSIIFGKGGLIQGTKLLGGDVLQHA